MNIDEVMKQTRIATPCSVKWDELSGDDKVRYCGQCHLNVLNASAMTENEVLTEIRKAAGGQRVCMRLFRREDGTFITRDCPIGLRALRQRARRVAAWVAGILAAFVSLPSHAQTGDKTESADKKKPVWHSKILQDNRGQAVAPAAEVRSAPVNTGPRELMGDVAYVPKLPENMVVLLEKVAAARANKTFDTVSNAENLAALSQFYDLNGNKPEGRTLAENAIDICLKVGRHKRAAEICDIKMHFCRMNGDETGAQLWEKKKTAIDANALKRSGQ